MQPLISPHYPQDKLKDPTIEDLIDVLEDRVRFWLLEPARVLSSHAFGQVAGLALLMSYFEGIWTYVQGRDSHKQSRVFFKDAFIDVFRLGGLAPELLGRIAEVLYEDARCGFFHDGLFRHGIFFGKNLGGCLRVTMPLKDDGRLDEEGEIQSIILDVEDFFKFVEGHFDRLIVRLRNPNHADLRTKFREICRKNGISKEIQGFSHPNTCEAPIQCKLRWHPYPRIDAAVLKLGPKRRA
ncbi:MAG: hypothetical protein WAM82_05825 [Thermoanaerobaculia bacterium]